jgi:hypothetical protein
MTKAAATAATLRRFVHGWRPGFDMLTGERYWVPPTTEFGDWVDGQKIEPMTDAEFAAIKEAQT